MGGDVESVLKDVGISEEDAAPSQPASERVWLHCNIGGRVDEKKIQGKEDGDEVRRCAGAERLLG